MPPRHNRNAYFTKSSRSNTPQLTDRPSKNTYSSSPPWSPQLRPMGDIESTMTLLDNGDDDGSSSRVGGDLDSAPAHTQGDRLPFSEMAGHSRSPVLAREPTMLESLSRTVRNYVPSSVPLSIPIPIAAPSPPLVSKPVSFGSFASPTSRISQGGASNDVPFDGGVFASDEDMETVGWLKPGTAAYPSAPRSDDPEGVIWSKWDKTSGRTLLILGYATGLQIWDCTDLKSVQEIFNITSSRVLSASILSRPQAGDVLASESPLLGMITTTSGDNTAFLIYSLSRHRIVKTIEISGLYTFSSSAQFIVLSAINPPTLHIISSSTFTVLHTIPPSYLSTFPRKSKHPNISIDVSLQDVDIHRPIFDLSLRLLAYTSPIPSKLSFSNNPITGRSHAHNASPPNSSSPTSTTGTSPSGKNPFSSGFSVPMTQAELGTAAYKVGGTVLNGMMSLGGMAFSAATKAGDHVRSRTNNNAVDTSLGVPTSKIFQPRSVPTGTGDVWRSPIASIPTRPLPTSTKPDGYHVVILDLSPLLRSAPPATIAHFLVSKHQLISNLVFTEDGTSILVSPSDGQVLKLYRINPCGAKSSVISRRAGAGLAEHDVHNPPWHIYNLRRGRTSAVIETVNCSADGRWIAVGTNHRTIHVFPTNSYGGNADIRSHTEGRVRNVNELQPFPVDMQPLARFRSKAPAPDHLHVPMSLLFLDSSESRLPVPLMPGNVTASPYLKPRTSSEELATYSSTRHHDRPRNYQDALLFDPTDGNLSMRRIFVEVRRNDATISSGSSNLSTSSNMVSHSPRISGLTQMMESTSELTSKESVVATWDLSRHIDWGEIRQEWRQDMNSRTIGKPGDHTSRNWLSEAELSTSSKSLRVLPRSLYLSHQFFFYTLGEDYHALIRLYRLGIVGTRLEMRKQVEINVHSAGNGASFVEGFSPSRSSLVSSSFDEPLASALSAELDYLISPTVLPMYPNGTPSSKPRSFRNTIPIRSVAAGLSDGMSEGFERIRREMHKARSPRSSMMAKSSSAESVPLEFDEEDEDFLAKLNTVSEPVRSSSMMAADGQQEISTPLVAIASTPSLRQEMCIIPPTSDDDESWQGWDHEDKKALDDVERFDDISVVGFLEEEQEDVIKAQRERESAREELKARKTGRKKAGRKK